MLWPHELSPKGGGIWTVACISQYSFSSLGSQSVITTKKTDAYTVYISRKQYNPIVPWKMIITGIFCHLALSPN